MISSKSKSLVPRASRTPRYQSTHGSTAIVPRRILTNIRATNAEDGKSSSKLTATALLPKLVLAQRVTSVLVTGSLVHHYYNGSLFSLHPVFMSLGFLLFFPEAIVQASSMFTKLGPERDQAALKHVLMVVPGVASVLSSAYVIYNVIQGQDPSRHLVSAHSKLGAAAIILMLQAQGNGAFSWKWLTGGLTKMLPGWGQRLIVNIHRVWGGACFLLALTALQMMLKPAMVAQKVGVALIGGLTASIVYYSRQAGVPAKPRS